MSFTNDVKEEIMLAEYNDKQDKMILRAFLMSNLEISIIENNLTWNVFSSFIFILKFIHNMLIKYYDIQKKFYVSEYMFGKIKKYKMVIDSKTDNINDDLKVFEMIDNNISIDEAKYYLIGFFLSIGSVNSPRSKTYHLEFRVKNSMVYESLISCLKILNIEYKVMERKNIIIIYFKKSEIISDILKLMGANNSMFIFEDSRIQKDFTNQIHRLNNLDVSNIKKTINSSKEFESYMQIIYDDEYKLKKLSKNELIFCKLKKEHPEFSLNELSSLLLDKYDISISKSGLNHYVRKIKKIALE